MAIPDSRGPVEGSQVIRGVGKSEPASGEFDAVPEVSTVFGSEPLKGARALIYGDYYGLTESPFELTPDSKFLFLTVGHREALGNLRYGLANSRGLTVLLGDAGTGKTTLIRTAIEGLGQQGLSRYVLLSNPTLGRDEFYEFLANEFGFSNAAANSKTKFLSELQADVVDRFANGGLTGLIVDEAQSMPHELLEEIRLLGNIETTSTKLLNIVLSGQPELADRLNEPRLRQLKQRVALRCELKPFTQNEALSYVAGRLRIAGGKPEQIFSVEAVKQIHQASSGIPRSVNVLCDNALISGFAAQMRPITLAIVLEVCKDFDLHASSAPAPAQGVADSAAPNPPAAPTAVAEPEMFRSVRKNSRLPFSFFS